MSNQENLETTLSGLGIAALNEMQQQANTAIQENSEILLLSPTGSGKTLAFLLPLLSILQKDVADVQCIVIVPTRSWLYNRAGLAENVNGFKVTCCYGGHDMQTEIRSLSEAPALLIGTPGRLMDHIFRKTFTTRKITTLVLDEFDKSLELGFQDEMAEIMGNLRALKKTILVSATAGTKVPAFTRVKNPVELDFIENRKQNSGLTVKMVLSEKKDKTEKLVQLLSFLGAESTLIFCNLRESVERLSSILKEEGIDCAYFHGKLEQEDRERTLIRFGMDLFCIWRQRISSARSGYS